MPGRKYVTYRLLFELHRLHCVYLSLMELKMNDQLSEIDVAARMARRQLLLALSLLLFLGFAALLSLGTPALAAMGHALWTMMPVLIAISVAALYVMGKRVDKRSMRAVREDELRQTSLNRAWRNGFLVILGTQPLAATAIAWWPMNHETAAMAAISVVTGSLTVLASLLWYDR